MRAGFLPTSTCFPKHSEHDIAAVPPKTADVNDIAPDLKVRHLKRGVTADMGMTAGTGAIPNPIHVQRQSKRGQPTVLLADGAGYATKALFA